MSQNAELAFARVLAHNDKTIRQRAVKKLTKWLASKGAEMTPEELLKLWKGLFYCMWMSDKPLVQQDLAVRLAGLVGVFATHKAALAFTRAFFTTMHREWAGIDKLRIDKFYNLVTEFLRAVFRRLRAAAWNLPMAERVVRLLLEGPLRVQDDTLALGVPLHVCEHFGACLLAAATPENPPPAAVVKVLMGAVWQTLTAARGACLFDRVDDGIVGPLLKAPLVTVDWQSAAQTLFDHATSADLAVVNRDQLHALRRRILAAAGCVDPLMPTRKRKHDGDDDGSIVGKDTAVLNAAAVASPGVIDVVASLLGAVVPAAAEPVPPTKKQRKMLLQAARAKVGAAILAAELGAKQLENDQAAAAEAEAEAAEAAAVAAAAVAQKQLEDGIAAAAAAAAAASGVSAGSTGSIAAQAPAKVKKSKKTRIATSAPVLSPLSLGGHLSGPHAVAPPEEVLHVTGAHPTSCTATDGWGDGTTDGTAIVPLPPKKRAKSPLTLSFCNSGSSQWTVTTMLESPAPAVKLPAVLTPAIGDRSGSCSLTGTPKSVLRRGSGEHHSTASTPSRRVSWGANEHKPFFKKTPPAAVGATEVRRAGHSLAKSAAPRVRL